MFYSIVWTLVISWTLHINSFFSPQFKFSQESLRGDLIYNDAKITSWKIEGINPIKQTKAVNIYWHIWDSYFLKGKCIYLLVNTSYSMRRWTNTIGEARPFLKTCLSPPYRFVFFSLYHFCSFTSPLLGQTLCPNQLEIVKRSNPPPITKRLRVSMKMYPCKWLGMINAFWNATRERLWTILPSRTNEEMRDTDKDTQYNWP